MPPDVTTDRLDVARGGPAYRLWQRLGLAGPGATAAAARIGLFVALTWAPLAILSVAEGSAWTESVRMPFFRDAGAHARLLVSASLLLLAEGPVGAFLSKVLRRIDSSMLIPEEGRRGWTEAIERLLRRRDSTAAELAALVLGFSGPWALLATGKLPTGTSWTSWRLGPDSSALTWAGLWYAAVSLPLYHFLVYRWLWRGGIWGALLSRLARLPLRLRVTHPDLMGGLAIVADGQMAFGAPVFALAATLGGTMANHVLYGGEGLEELRYTAFAFAALAVVLPLAPLLVFSRPLIRAKRRGIIALSGFSDRCASLFEEKWFGPATERDAHLLGSGNVSELADLGTAYEAARRTRVLAVNPKVALALAGAALIPFLPPLLALVPLEEILSRLKVLFW